jgi:hypothetical protein
MLPSQFINRKTQKLMHLSNLKIFRRINHITIPPLIIQFPTFPNLHSGGNFRIWEIHSLLSNIVSQSISLDIKVFDFLKFLRCSQSTQEFPFPSPTPQPTQQPQSQPQSVIYNKESQTQRLVDVPQGRPQKSTSSGLSPALLGNINEI